MTAPESISRTRTRRIQMHREFAAVYRKHGMSVTADNHDRIADLLERADALGRSIAIAGRDLTGAFPVAPDDPAP